MATKIILPVLSCFCASLALAADTLYQGGHALNSSKSDTLVSKNGLFILGFVTLGSDESNASYLGIWYNESKTSTIQPFWIANRDKPIADNSGVLAIDGKGNMKLSYTGGDVVDLYSSQSSTSNLTAILEDSGNFVLKEANSNGDEVLWQSFDYPTNTLLPGMKLGVNHRTNKTWSLVSWLSGSIPSVGAFSFEWDPSKQELVIKRRGIVYWTSGSLKSNGSFENVFDYQLDLDFSFINVSNADEDYFKFTVARNQFSSQDQRNFSMWWLRDDGAIENRPNGLLFGGDSTTSRESNSVYINYFLTSVVCVLVRFLLF